MFTQIKTSAKNREIVVDLTRKFNLGAENVIARIAIAYSLKSGVKFNPTDAKDSGGKEYSRAVLFGSNDFLYIAKVIIERSLHEVSCPRLLIDIIDGCFGSDYVEQRILRPIIQTPHIIKCP